ncbi:hypothetical protein ACFTAO_13845 [Paenibacillus rhizoplanae]
MNQLRFLAEVLEGTKENIPLSESYERVATMNAIYEMARNKHAGQPTLEDRPDGEVVNVG